MKKINMHFDANGNVKIEAEGFSGGECLEATKPFEDMFSKTVKEREMTGECVPVSERTKVT